MRHLVIGFTCFCRLSNGCARSGTVLLSLLVAGTVALCTGCGQSSKTSADGPRTAPAGAHGGGSSCVPPRFLLSASPPPLPKKVSTPLESGIAAHFAVFRRGPLGRDNPRDVDAASGALSHILGKYYELASYYSAYVRRLTASRGGPNFVVPAFARPELVPPARCLPTGVHAVRVEQQRRRAAEPVFCTIEASGSRTRPLGCEPFAQVDASLRAFHASDLLGREPIIEMVPDGVAWVRVTYGGTSPLTVPVVENAFEFTPPPAPHDQLTAYLRVLLPKLSGEGVTSAGRLAATKAWNRAFVGTYPIRIEWLDGSRKVIRSIGRPTQKTIAATDLGDLRAPLQG